MKTWDVFTTADQLRNAIRAAAASDITDPLPAFPTATDIAVLVFLPGATGPAWLVATVTATATAADAGLAKAWFESTTATATGLLTSLNVTDLTRLASGRWRVNGLPFAASGYAFSLGCETAAGGGGFALKTATGSQLAGSFEVSFVNVGGAFYDPASFSGVFFGAT